MLCVISSCQRGGVQLPCRENNLPARKELNKQSTCEEGAVELVNQSELPVVLCETVLLSTKSVLKETKIYEKNPKICFATSVTSRGFGLHYSEFGRAKV